jgi:hypothetical protein
MTVVSALKKELQKDCKFEAASAIQWDPFWKNEWMMNV